MRTAQRHSPTKERLFDAAQELMLAKGFPATTVEEICDEAGVTKGSFFHYFESKEKLGKELLKRFSASTQQKIEEAPFHKEKDPLRRVYGYLEFTIQMCRDPQRQQGCLLGTFAQELSDTYPEIRSCCAQSFSEWADAFQGDLDEAKGKYPPKGTVDTKGLAEHFIAVMEGSLILAKAQGDMGVTERNIRHFKQYLKSLFGR